MRAKRTLVTLNDLKCDERTPWNALKVVAKKRGSYVIQDKTPRAVIDHSGYARTKGRQSKRENPYSQVWSFLSRFPTLDTEELQLAAVPKRQFRRVMSPFAPRDFAGFTQLLEVQGPRIAARRRLDSLVCAFALMVACAKAFYSSVYQIVGMHHSRETLVQCNDMVRAGRTQRQMEWTYQTVTLPNFLCTIVWAHFLGPLIFGATHGKVIMHAWMRLFLEKSADRIDLRRSKKRDQRLHLQQRDVDFTQLLLEPLDMPAQFNMQTPYKPVINMPGPLPYDVGRSWKSYIQTQQTARFKRALGFQNSSRVTTAGVTFAECSAEV